MYADNGLFFSYYHNLPQEPQVFEDFSCSLRPSASMMTSAVSEYDLGGEGDLFKAPEPIIEEPFVDLDPIPMISCAEDVISSQVLKVSDIEASFENEQLLSDVLYGCNSDLLSKGVETPPSDVFEAKVPIAKTNEEMAAEKYFASQGSFQKSVSSECLSSMEFVQGAPMRPNFLGFSEMDFSAAYGMRRSFSEGDIKALGHGSTSLIHSPLGQPQIIGSSISEDRKEKLSRYRIKRTKRNFGRKIKYACRKALADCQPRIRGRFAKTEEQDAAKKHLQLVNSLLARRM